VLKGNISTYRNRKNYLSDTAFLSTINIYQLSGLGLSNATETNAPNKYRDFKSFVMSKVIRTVDDCKDIKLAIHATLNEFIHEYDLTGWIRHTPENNTTHLIKENNSIIKENNSLTKKNKKLEEQLSKNSKTQIGIYSFEQLTKILKNKKFKIPAKISKTNDITVNALTVFITYFDTFVTGISNEFTSSDDIVYVFYHIAPYYVSFDLLEPSNIPKTTAQRIQITKNGSRFYSMLEANNMIKS